MHNKQTRACIRMHYAVRVAVHVNVVYNVMRNRPSRPALSVGPMGLVVAIGDSPNLPDRAFCAYDVGMPTTIFDRLRQMGDTSQLANRPSSLPRHEGEGESNNEHLCGSLHPVADQNVNRGDVRVRK